jgi:hypothetical protein
MPALEERHQRVPASWKGLRFGAVPHLGLHHLAEEPAVEEEPAVQEQVQVLE